MTLQQLRYAITISETGSFNKASEVLCIAQPSLTGSIKELERELGVTIFNRSGKGVTLTNDGTEFLVYARQVYSQYEALQEKFGKGGGRKKKFCVSTQHYSFAVKAFVETTRDYGGGEYEFAIRETKTRDVIEDVAALRSEVGILYMNRFNRAVLTKILKANALTFKPLIDCKTYVYLWKGHPLAGRKTLKWKDLTDYPCLTFEQDGSESFYFAEEGFHTHESAKTIKVRDRATVLNLMVGLDAYTICSGIICEELNGEDYLAVPFEDAGPNRADTMELGYILRRDRKLSDMGGHYIQALERYLGATAKG